MERIFSFDVVLAASGVVGGLGPAAADVGDRAVRGGGVAADRAPQGGAAAERRRRREHRVRGQHRHHQDSGLYLGWY